MNEHYEDLLALAILSTKTHANAYSLCSGLSRKFNIINCSAIINRIETKGYVNVTYQESEQLKSFTLTSTGKSLLIQEKLGLSEILKSNFPEEFDFIDLLVGNVSK
jgi:DNA-binding PadR family transcriptional regulator